MELPLHPDCEPIAFLLGTWAGEGKGSYPTIEPFSYREEVRFWHEGKPYLAYRQRTWAPDDGRPLHAEMGYWRPQPHGRLEVLLAHPTGVAEVAEGTLRGGRIELVSSSVALTATAKDVRRICRRIEVAGDVLRYELRMAAVGLPLTTHLEAELRRV